MEHNISVLIGVPYRLKKVFSRLKIGFLRHLQRQFMGFLTILNKMQKNILAGLFEDFSGVHLALKRIFSKIV